VTSILPFSVNEQVVVIAPHVGPPPSHCLNVTPGAGVAVSCRTMFRGTLYAHVLLQLIPKVPLVTVPGPSTVMVRSGGGGGGGVCVHSVCSPSVSPSPLIAVSSAQ